MHGKCPRCGLLTEVNDRMFERHQLLGDRGPCPGGGAQLPPPSLPAYPTMLECWLDRQRGRLEILPGYVLDALAAKLHCQVRGLPTDVWLAQYEMEHR